MTAGPYTTTITRINCRVVQKPQFNNSTTRAASNSPAETPCIPSASTVAARRATEVPPLTPVCWVDRRQRNAPSIRFAGGNGIQVDKILVAAGGIAVYFETELPPGFRSKGENVRGEKVAAHCDTIAFDALHGWGPENVAILPILNRGQHNISRSRKTLPFAWRLLRRRRVLLV